MEGQFPTAVGPHTLRFPRQLTSFIGRHEELAKIVALLDKGDLPAVLAHAESEAAAQGRAEFGAEVPMVNQVAVTRRCGLIFPPIPARRYPRFRPVFSVQSVRMRQQGSRDR
jgi:hypothetical protein